jgi:hypothetical protein
MDGYGSFPSIGGDYGSGQTSFDVRNPSTIPSFNGSSAPDIGGDAVPAQRIPESGSSSFGSQASSIGVGFLQTLLDVFRAKTLPKTSPTTVPPSKGGSAEIPTIRISGKAASLWPWILGAVLITGAVVWEFRRHRV